MKLELSFSLSKKINKLLKCIFIAYLRPACLQYATILLVWLQGQIGYMRDDAIRDTLLWLRPLRQCTSPPETHQ